MKHRILTPLLALASLTAAAPIAAKVPVTLRGSPASMVRQNEVAKESDYSFLRTPAEVREFEADGRLVRLEGNGDYKVAKGVSFPVVRPETRVLVERLGAQHRAACGAPLVVTSATRPLSGQPSNAHALSVHPTGMALDLRVERDPDCLRWLETALLALEGKGVLDVTRERTPPHFHVAVFPGAYRAYLERIGAGENDVLAAKAEDAAPVEESPLAAAAAALEAMAKDEVAQDAKTAPRAQMRAAAAPAEQGDALEGALVALGLVGVAVGGRIRRRRAEDEEMEAPRRAA